MSTDVAPVSASVLWHTLRHLRPRQILAQLGKRARQRLVDPRHFANRATPPYPGCDWILDAEPPAPGGRVFDARELLGGEFEFVGRSVALGWPPRWEPSEMPRLWQYNLHYFEWLWALDYAAARAAVSDWIRRHDLARGRVGWEPFPVSLRLQNWLGVFFGRHRERTESDRAWLDLLWPSIWRQTEWLRRNVEYHLMGNHLLENAVALVWCGACFRGDAAARWSRHGLPLLQRELDEQILPDGMHFERSPMYHQRAVYLLLLLCTLRKPELRQRLVPKLERMIVASRKLLHPDGEIALLNDSALDIANDATVLLDAARPWIDAARIAAADESGPWSLPDAGYYGFRRGGTYIVCDAGAVGPDYMAGHAHGDLFSFELSFGGRRVIADAGVYSYEPDEMRGYCRSTASHNTVEIDGQDQCEFWHVFRVGRRARPSDIEWAPHASGFRLSGQHDGYARLTGAPRHRRTFEFDASSLLRIVDRIDAAAPVAAASRIHLHPGWHVEARGPREATIGDGTRRLRLSWAGAVDEVACGESWYCPRFGTRQPRVCFEARGRGSRLELTFGLAPC